jgi:hypothetical protein
VVEAERRRRKDKASRVGSKAKAHWIGRGHLVSEEVDELAS